MKMIIALNSVRAIHSSNNQTKVEHILAKIPDKDVTRRSLGDGFKDVFLCVPLQYLGKWSNLTSMFPLGW